MGFFDNISSRKPKTLNASKPPPAGNRGKPISQEQTNRSSGISHASDARSAEHFSPTQRAAYIPTAPIPNAQAFVTSDTPFNAGASNYVQSTMKKKQMMDAAKAEGLEHAAKSQAVLKNHMQQAQLNEVGRPGEWPLLPPYLDIPGRDLRDPSYSAMLSHLGVPPAFLTVVSHYYGKSLDSIVKPRLVEKRHILQAGRESCDKMNQYLSEKWSMYLSLSFVWDASIDEGAFRLAYPQRKTDRFKWAEQVKGPRWSKDDWDEWNAGKKRLGVA